MKRLFFKKQLIRQWFGDRSSIIFRSDRKTGSIEQFTLEEVCNMFNAGCKFYCEKEDYMASSQMPYFLMCFKYYSSLLFDDEPYRRPGIRGAIDKFLAYIAAEFATTAFYGGINAIVYIIACYAHCVNDDQLSGMLHFCSLALLFGAILLPASTISHFIFRHETVETEVFDYESR